MSRQLTTEDARQSLKEHVVAKALEIREKYGPHIGWNELQRLLEDRAYVRYPCSIVFEHHQLQPGEFAHPAPSGEQPEEGFTMYVHPYYLTQPEKIPFLVLYQLVLVNYGEFATADDAEAFGASVLGLSQDKYYATLCKLADELAVTDDLRS